VTVAILNPGFTEMIGVFLGNQGYVFKKKLNWNDKIIL